MNKELTVSEICVILNITTFEDKTGKVISLYNVWTPFLENKIRTMLANLGWSVLYNPNNVVIRKRQKYFMGSNFLEALRKYLNGRN